MIFRSDTDMNAIIIEYSEIKNRCQKIFYDIELEDCAYKMSLMDLTLCDYCIVINGKDTKVIKNRNSRTYDYNELDDEDEK